MLLGPRLLRHLSPAKKEDEIQKLEEDVEADGDEDGHRRRREQPVPIASRGRRASKLRQEVKVADSLDSAGKSTRYLLNNGSLSDDRIASAPKNIYVNVSIDTIVITMSLIVPEILDWLQLFLVKWVTHPPLRRGVFQPVSPHSQVLKVHQVSYN